MPCPLNLRVSCDCFAKLLKPADLRSLEQDKFHAISTATTSQRESTIRIVVHLVEP